MRRPVANPLAKTSPYRVCLSFVRGLNLKSTILGFMALIIIVSSILSTGIVAFLPTAIVSAASPKAKEGNCENSLQFTNYSSPFSATAGQCLGRDTVDDLSFYQFAINLPGKISGVKVSGEDGSGLKIGFVKQSDTQYVSTDGINEGLGYQASGSSAAICDKTFAPNKITITVSGGENNPDDVLLPFNLCDYWNKDFVVYPPVSGVNADGSDGGTGVSTGTIIGNFCSIRNSNNALPGQETGLLDKLGVKSITLTGKATSSTAYNPTDHLAPVNVLSGDGDDDWYTLTDGTLTIANLVPDEYKLSITYDDVVVLMSQSNGLGDPSATTSDLKLEVGYKVVLPGDPTYITDADGTPQCYNNDGSIGDPDNPPPVDEETSCVIDYIGWIICGIMLGLASVNDGVYTLVEGLLITAPLQPTDPETGNSTAQYIVWQAIRDISNVLLVVAFLIIIFSQATSIGISSYGIKKMLPRLIIAAIAINLSFFAMQIAVDLANLLGVGLHSFINSIATDAFNASAPNMGDVVSSFLAGTATATAALGLAALVGGFNASALAFFIFPFLLAGVLAALAAFLTLFLRNAIIVVLVMIAPLAFAAYLLPNTEGLFTKWRKLLTSMLLLFPMAALLFAGAKLAGFTVTSLGGPVNIFFGYTIMVLPLFMLPWLARQGGGIMDNIGGKLQGLAGKAKQPLQNFVKPYVDRERDAYTSKSAGLFGRRRGIDPETDEPLADQKAWRAEQKRIKARRKSWYGRDADGKRFEIPGVDEHGNPIQPDNRTLRQKIAQGRKNVEGDAANYKELVERQYTQRAVTDPYGKTGKVVAQKEDLHLMKEGQEAELKNHQLDRMNTGGTAANAYANRIADAGLDKNKLENIQKSVQAKRVLDPTTRSTMQHGQRLATVARTAYAAEEAAKDDELQVDHQNKRDNVEADVAIASQKTTKDEIANIEGRQAEAHEDLKKLGPTEDNPEGSRQYQAAVEAEAIKRRTASSTATVTDLVGTALKDRGDIVTAANEKFRAETSSAITEGSEKNRQKARLGPKGDLTKLGDKKGATDLREQELNAAAEARSLVLQVDDPDVTVPNAPEDDVRKEYTDAAEGIAEARSIQRMAPGVEGLVRAAKIQADPQGELAKRLAGTKDSTGIASGISKTTAQIAGRAAQDILADQTGDTAVTREEFKEEGLDNNGFLEVLGKPRNKKGKRLPNTAPVVKKSDGSVSREGEKVSFIDQTAAIEGIAENGDYHANLIALEFSIEANKAAAAARIEAARVEEENRAAAASGNPDAIKATKDALEFAATKRKEALSYARAIAKSRLLPPYLGAEELNGLGAGTLTDTLEEIEIEKAKGGDITLKKLEGSDKDHLVHLADTLADTYSNPDEVARVNSDPEAKASLQRLLVAIDAIDSDPAYDSTSHRKPGAQKAYERMRRLITEKFGVPKVMSRSGDLEDYVRPAYVAANQKDETKAWTPEPWRIQFGDDIDATDDDPSSP